MSLYYYGSLLEAISSWGLRHQSVVYDTLATRGMSILHDVLAASFSINLFAPSHPSEIVLFSVSHVFSSQSAVVTDQSTLYTTFPIPRKEQLKYLNSLAQCHSCSAPFLDESDASGRGHFH